MLGHRDFDTNHNWGHTQIPLHLQNSTISFLDLNSSSNQAELQPFSIPASPNCFSPTQRTTFEIIMSHYTQHTTTKPLRMIIQGTAGTRISFLMGWLQAAFSSSSPNNSSPLLLLAPTGVAAFNINSLTIHSALRIPINTMLPLEGQALANLQEWLLHIRYVLIDEMSFIGPKLLSNIDSRLREAFPSHRTSPFGGCSVILVGDLGQLPPVKDIPMYVGASWSLLDCEFKDLERH